MGTSWARYPLHFQRIVYSKNVKNAQQEAQATKNLALAWFCRHKSFDTTAPTKSYAVAVKTDIHKFNVTVPTIKNSKTRVAKNVVNKDSSNLFI